MEQKQFLNRWPSQAEFDAHEKLQAEIADLQVAEPVAPEANMVINVTMTIYGVESDAPEPKPEPRCAACGREKSSNRHDVRPDWYHAFVTEPRHE